MPRPTLRHGGRLVKLLSYGNKHTKLKDAKLPEDLPFWGGSDNKEHDCKGFFRDACGSELFVNGEEIRLDRTIADLRGLVPVPDSDDVFPSAAGDYSYSKYNGESLEEILADCDAYSPESWHREYCFICTKKVIDNKDKMATEPAVRASQLGPLLRAVGAEAEASYCGLMAMIRAFSRGADQDPRVPGQRTGARWRVRRAHARASSSSITR